MTLETIVLEALSSKPSSGGRLIERFQADGSGLVAGRAVAVYGALLGLRARGAVDVLSSGPGEAVWGVPDSERSIPVAAPGFPPSFALGTAELGLIDREVSAMTAGLPLHYFEELRRVVVADADRRVFDGAKLPGAVMDALADLGPEGSVRRYLRALERGKPVELASAKRLRGPWRSLGVFAVLVFCAWLLLGFYTVPAASISMAPTLIPGREGGDQLVVAGLYSAWLERPARGEVWVFDVNDEMLVKRVMGLPSETISIKKGDLFVNGKRLVKERALLDRVKVPLFFRDDFEVTEAPAGWRQPQPAHSGWLLPDGSTEQAGAGICRDVVFRVVLRAAASATVTFVLETGAQPAHTLVLGKTGGAAVAGIEVAMGAEFALTGEGVEVWLTNADRVFRVELDGREVARAPIARDEAAPRLAIVADGKVELSEVEVARDLIHAGGTRAEWKVPAGEYFVLGDNTTQSRDSRQFGPIPVEQLRGRLLAVLWPPRRIRLVE